MGSMEGIEKEVLVTASPPPEKTTTGMNPLKRLHQWFTNRMNTHRPTKVRVIGFLVSPAQILHVLVESDAKVNGHDSNPARELAGVSDVEANIAIHSRHHQITDFAARLPKPEQHHGPAIHTFYLGVADRGGMNTSPHRGGKNPLDGWFVHGVLEGNSTTAESGQSDPRNLTVRTCKQLHVIPIGRLSIHMVGDSGMGKTESLKCAPWLHWVLMSHSAPRTPTDNENVGSATGSSAQ